MKKFLVVCAVVFLCSAILGCGGAGAGGGDGGGGGGTTTTQEKKFWAQNVSTGTSYQLDAQLLASNTRCEVWVEKGSAVTEAAARNVASEFNNVYTKLMNTTTGLGWQLNIDGRQTNTMQFADMLGDGNQKLIILLLDIRDGYTNEGDPYVAGYFDGVQFFDDSTAQTVDRRSNECDMIYMDINPSVIGPSFYGTLAHEMQHLMNFVTSVLLIGNEIRDSFMDLWIDEGLSAAAEWIYSGQLDESRIAWYHNDPTGFIAQGDNFFVWDNYSDPSAVLNDYATVNLFFHWLRLNNPIGGELFKHILLSEYTSVYHDYRTITGLFTSESPWSKWETMIGDWHAANFIKNPNSSRWGYKNVTLLNSFKTHYMTEGLTTVNLFPGEGVFSHAPSTNYSGADPISFLYLTSSAISTTYSGTTNTLLTFNSKNTVDEPPVPVPGATTGLVPPANVKASISGTRVAIKPESYRVSAGDMLRRNGHNFNPSSFAPVPNNNTGRSVIIDSKPIPRINAGDLPNVKLTLKD